MSRDALAGLEGELGGDVALLGELGLGEAGHAFLEVGAGILQVVVEEEGIEAAVEVVVVLDVVLRAVGRVELAEAPQVVAGAADAPQPPRLVDPGQVFHERQHQVGDGALFHDVAAVHVLLAELQVGVEETARSARSLVKRMRIGVPVPSPKRWGAAVSVDDFQRPAGEQPGMKLRSRLFMAKRPSPGLSVDAADGKQPGGATQC